MRADYATARLCSSDGKEDVSEVKDISETEDTSEIEKEVSVIEEDASKALVDISESEVSVSEIQKHISPARAWRLQRQSRRFESYGVNAMFTVYVIQSERHHRF